MKKETIADFRIAAEATYSAYKEFIEAGFTPEEALELVKVVIEKGVKK